MKGDPAIVEILNEALKLELGAVNQYWLHYRLLEDWGYGKLAKKARAESIEEMHHADKLIERIIFLEGHPNLQHVAPLFIGENVTEVLECDLKGEYTARELYMKGRSLCRDKEDYVTMQLFEELLADEEGHIDFLAARTLEIYRRRELRPIERTTGRRRGLRRGISRHEVSIAIRYARRSGIHGRDPGTR